MPDIKAKIVPSPKDLGLCLLNVFLVSWSSNYAPTPSHTHKKKQKTKTRDMDACQLWGNPPAHFLVDIYTPERRETIRSKGSCLFATSLQFMMP